MGGKFWRWLLIVWLAGFTIALIFAYNANSHRVSDIQKSRLTSCERTYEGIREVFKPFFPPPKTATPKQLADQSKFNRTIIHLKARCATQIRTAK